MTPPSCCNLKIPCPPGSDAKATEPSHPYFKVSSRLSQKETLKLSSRIRKSKNYVWQNESWLGIPFVESHVLRTERRLLNSGVDVVKESPEIEQTNGTKRERG
ncbi:hypothetical protein P691DRAFT_819181 [Macrolepiota fuliginosa MF-IS2]|uniref:Uncharacterized protein n=1 Tax=Macrolepiota fuliginosa MF-IS2 TaxID=1400762 RepID=A0A9P6BVC7_9AGAR|nr:hypothetical protein P691DRAFT_819181 [Macrolepiota fuliginosa MF-IS2]